MRNNQTLNHTIRNLMNIFQRTAQRKRLAFLLPGMLVVLVSACSLPGAANATTAPAGIASPNAPVAAQPAANKSVLPDDPRAAVEYALRAQPKALPFKVTTTIGSGNTQMNSMIEIETPQRIMMVVGTHSVISLDGQCYEKTGEAAWQTCANASTGQTAQTGVSTLLDQATIEAAISIIQTVKLAGNETLNGKNARIYEYTTSGKLMGMQVDGTTRLWVDEKTGLPVKSVADSTAGGYTSSSTQLISYDPTIKVQAP